MFFVSKVPMQWSARLGLKRTLFLQYFIAFTPQAGARLGWLCGSRTLFPTVAMSATLFAVCLWNNALYEGEIFSKEKKIH
jgi:hypothetical protein